MAVFTFQEFCIWSFQDWIQKEVWRARGIQKSGMPGNGYFWVYFSVSPGDHFPRTKWDSCSEVLERPYQHSISCDFLNFPHYYFTVVPSQGLPVRVFQGSRCKTTLDDFWKSQKITSCGLHWIRQSLRPTSFTS